MYTLKRPDHAPYTSFTYVVKIALAGYLDYFLKMRTSENRTTEIRRSQWPSVYILLKILFSLDFNLVLDLQTKNNFH